jgi:predicted protein tyrosine phosphatase
MEISMNRMATTKNPYQGKFKKVLCVCSAGCLRSPTAAVVLSQEPFNFNTRACGLDIDFAIIPIDDVLIEWANEIVCMDKYQQIKLKEKTNKAVICLNISDSYEYRDPELMRRIKEQYLEASK